MNTKRLLLSALTAISSFILGCPAFAEVPNLINYQGRLRGSDPQKPLNGTIQIRVDLFTNEVGGASQFTQNIGPVPITNGVYSLAFGDSSLPGLLSKPEVWLQVTADGNILAPRQRLLAVPYAAVAGTVQGSGLYVDPANGHVGIGTVSPSSAVPLTIGPQLPPVEGAEVIWMAGDSRYCTWTTDVSGNTFRLFTCDTNQPTVNIMNCSYAGGNNACNLLVQGDIISQFGKVGIGTATPAARLHVSGPTNDVALRVENRGHNMVAHFQVDHTGGFGFGNGLELMNANPTPNNVTGIVGMNASGLGVAGIEFANVNHGGIGSRQGGVALFVVDTSDATHRVHLLPNGNLGVDTSTPSEKLEVAGKIKCVSLQQTSDARFKKEVKPIAEPLETVRQLRGVEFSWDQQQHPNAGFDDRRHFGLLAQEVEKILPQTVATTPDGTKSLDYTALIPVLLEAVKAQQQEIEKLEQTVQRLQKGD